MNNIETLDEEQNKVLEKIEKLMRLAARNPNPEEAAAATAKAQELLVAYNLDASLIGQGGQAGDARREQAKVLGGMYKYQRYLWRAVAELNFCMYWTQERYTTRNTKTRGWDGQWLFGKVPYMRNEHVVVGKRVNARATIAMGEYLQQTIERLVKDRYPLNSQRFLSDAVAFREGIADELYWRLLERRRQLRAEEAERRTRDAAAAGVSTAQALTLASLEESERDANLDHLYGEGYSARQRQQRAERAEASRKAEEAYTQWAAANPEEAAKEEKKREKELKGRSRGGVGSRGGMDGASKRQQSGAYWQGREEGKKVGLDMQTTDRKKETRAIT